MNIENIIRTKRCLEYAVYVKKDEYSKKLLEELLKEYNSKLEICDHACYIDKGYYKYHNNDIYKTPKEEAEFRCLICPKCGKEVILLKTHDTSWDKKVNERELIILSAIDIKVLSFKSLESNIEQAIINYSNSNQKYCGHLEFINKGYYKIKDGEPVKGNYSNSDFRIVTCKYCNKTMCLPRTRVASWNSMIEENPITVTKVKKMNT